MNFEYMPELRFRYGYYVVVGLILVASASVFWWMWGAKLVGKGRRKVIELTPSMVKPRHILGAPAHARLTMVRYTRVALRVPGRKP